MVQLPRIYTYIQIGQIKDIHTVRRFHFTVQITRRGNTWRVGVGDTPFTFIFSTISDEVSFVPIKQDFLLRVILRKCYVSNGRLPNHYRMPNHYLYLIFLKTCWLFIEYLSFSIFLSGFCCNEYFGILFTYYVFYYFVYAASVKTWLRLNQF